MHITKINPDHLSQHIDTSLSCPDHQQMHLMQMVMSIVQVVRITVSYLGVPDFKSHPGDGPSLIEVFRGFPEPFYAYVSLY
jgi:hypothetical protein